MRARLVFAVLALMSLSFPALAEIKMPGYPCTELGITTMGDDRTTLVACLLMNADASSTGASCAIAATVGNSCVWKSMSTLIPVCTHSGEALQFDGTKFSCAVPPPPLHRQR